jgi:hypothetical protein
MCLCFLTGCLLILASSEWRVASGEYKASNTTSYLLLATGLLVNFGKELIKSRHRLLARS